MSGGRVVDTVVFDLFHTLINPEHFLRDSHLRAARIAAELQLDRNRFETFWASSRIARNSARTPTVSERIRDYCDQSETPRGPLEIEAALSTAGIPDDAAFANPSPSVIQTLRELRQRGCRLGVLSNCDERESKMWATSPLASLVDATAFSCDTGVLKPAPEAYDAILAELGTKSAEHCAYVGDGESDELPGAKRRGFAKVVLMRGFVRGTNFPGAARLPQAEREADSVVDDLHELLSDTSVHWAPPTR